ncbi:hypothetical protein SCLO_4000180 (plasmid) [Sphingobium cloacae]|uniref:Uncharacterized protein n=1 Tax=Sphingobium cloacae TaxID=120107 RepID=A0A1E1F8H6_9SPHN|nr:hypothetical protein SCLO_4000180 [Sphingobium cloacae]
MQQSHAQHLAAPPKAQLTRHQMDDDEFVTDVEGNQRLRPVWSHQIYSRHLAVRWETQHRELPVIGDLRRLKLAGALHLVVHVARPFDDPMIESAANGPALQGSRLHGNLRGPETRGAVCIVPGISEPHLKIGLAVAARDRTAASGQLERIAAQFASARRGDDEIGRSGTLTRLEEQDVPGDGDLPRYGVAQRDVLDRLIVAQDNLCCGPERADDPIDLGLFIFDELDARVGRTTSRNFDRVRRRYRHQRANDGGGERPHRITSGSAR